MGDARDRERAHEGAAAAIRDGALELLGRRGGIAQRQVRDGDQSPAGVAAEIGDPPVVRAAIRRRQLGVHQFGFPQEPDRRIENRLGQALAIEELDPLLHVHGAEPGPPQVRALRVRADAPHLLGTDLAAHGALAQVLGLVDTLSHPAQVAELPRPWEDGALAVDLEILEGVVADADANRAVAVARLEVLLPQIGRLEDVPVAIDQHGVRGHRALRSSPGAVVAPMRSRFTWMPAAARSQVSAVTPSVRSKCFCTFWVGVLGSSSKTW